MNYYNFEINEDLLAMLDEYHFKTTMMEMCKFEKKKPINALGKIIAKTNYAKETKYFDQSQLGIIFHDNYYLLYYYKV